MPDSRVTLPLYRFAHGRTGDKGNRSNISVIAYHPALWDVICQQVTEDAVGAVFADRSPTHIRRYLLPQLQAMNLVLDGVLDGGVNDALNLDSHGKTLCFRVLQMPIQMSASLHAQLEPHLVGPSNG